MRANAVGPDNGSMLKLNLSRVAKSALAILSAGLIAACGSSGKALSAKTTVTLVPTTSALPSNGGNTTASSAAATTKAPPTTAAPSRTTAAPNGGSSDTTAAPPRETLPNLYSAIGADGRFPTFVKLLDQAGLGDLVTKDELTIAIPSEEAFAALPAGTLTSISADKPKLVRLLKFHIVRGLITGDTVTSGQATTLEGSALAIALSDAGATINGAKVTAGGPPGKNGATFIIDTVLLPPGF
jgi:uncharacterized surface protein with fasciclin (FAS1) repeats